MRTRIALLLILWMAMVFPLIAQGGPPQQIWSQIFDLFEGGSKQYASSIVTIGDNIFFHAIQISQQARLVQMNKQTHQLGWQKNLSGANVRARQLVISNDQNLVIVDNGSIIRKVSAETGEDIWVKDLSGSPIQIWTLCGVPDYLICRGNRNGLILLNWQTGEIIKQLETNVPYVDPTGTHMVVSQDGHNVYLSDNCSDGQHWTTSVRVTKIIISSDYNNYQQSWQIKFDDEIGGTTIKIDDKLYVKSANIDPETTKLRQINENGQITWTQNIGNDYNTSSLINNGKDLIMCGMHYEDCKPVLISYAPDGSQNWRYKSPLPGDNFQSGMFLSGVWDQNTLILSGYASYTTNLIGALIWLSAVSFDTPNDDPPPPFDPKLNLTCYPNPFKGNTKIKFNQIDDGPITMSIYNIKGQLIRTLMEGELLPVGEHEVSWDGKTASGQQAVAGIYLCKLRSKEHSATRKVILVR